MNKPAVQLKPYVVLEPQRFQHYLAQLLRVIGAPQDTAWTQQTTQVREHMERLNPAILARFLSNRSTTDAMEMAYVFAVVALAVKYPLARGFRGWVIAELRSDRSDRVIDYPFSAHAPVREQITRVLELMRIGAPEPDVQVDLTPPEPPPLESNYQ